jgi:hypothetical protein
MKAADSITCGLVRPIRGFDRPLLQWFFVALGIALIAIVAAESIALRRARIEREDLRRTALDARVEREQTEFRLAHEQSAREALSLEVGRLRGGRGQASAPQPTLTLTASTKKGALPPSATVDPPPAAETIELRLMLPRPHGIDVRTFAVALRSWSGGETLWSRSGLTASPLDGREAVTARITGDVLAPGAYEIALTGVTTDHTSVEIASYEVAVRAPPR